MITEDITLGESGECVIGKVPMIEVLETHSKSIGAIGYFLKSVEGDWLNESIYLAKKEILSDYSIAVMVAKEEVESARKELKKKHPIRYRLNIFVSLGILIKKAWQRMLK